MPSLQLNFGYDAVWEIPNADHIASFLHPAASPLADVEAAVEAALADPVDFPSLDQEVVPGDSLVLAVDPTLPSLPEIIPSVIAWFGQRGTPLSHIKVVLADDSPNLADDLAAAVQVRLNDDIAIELHAPDDPNSLAYVAASDASDPIYLNRTLVDADVVLPVTCGRSSESLDYVGAFSLFPQLSDRATQGRFYNLSNLASSGARAKLTAWADDAARWAGFMTGIQVIPAGGERVGGVVAGLTEPLEAACQEKFEEIWNVQTSPSHLTVSLLDGGPAQQTWMGIARSLHIANRCTEPGGAIVLCTQARLTIGKSLRRLRDVQLSAEALQKKLAKDGYEDAIAAALIQQITNDKHIYLASSMNRDTVESLGLGVLHSPEELNHLIQQFPSCSILGSGQHRSLRLA